MTALLASALFLVIGLLAAAFWQLRGDIGAVRADIAALRTDVEVIGQRMDDHISMQH